MNLPANFLNDIQGKDTSLIPLVVFSDYDIDADTGYQYLFFSTNSVALDTYNNFDNGSDNSPHLNHYY